MSETQLYTNNARAVLNSNTGSIGISDTVIKVGNSSVFPVPGAGEFFLVTFEEGTTREIVKITGNNVGTNTLTATVRGYEGSAATAWVNGSVLELRPTASTFASYLTTDKAIEVYAPLNGAGTGGTWAISISGTAAVATVANGLSGTPVLPDGTTATTQSTSDTSAKVATDAFVAAYAPKLDGTNATGTWTIDTSGNAATATTAANLTGTPDLPNGTTATTQTPGDFSTQLATTAYVDDFVNQTHVWTKGQQGAYLPITSSGGVLDVSLFDSTHFSTTLTEDTNLNVPTNAVAGQSGVFEIINGTDTAFNFTVDASFWKWGNGEVGVVSNTAGSVNLLAYVISSTASFGTCSMIPGVA